MENVDDKLVRTLSSLEEISSYLENVEEIENSFDDKVSSISIRIEETYKNVKTLSSLIDKLNGSLSRFEESIKRLEEVKEKMDFLSNEIEKCDLKEIVDSCNKAASSSNAVLDKLNVLSEKNKKKKKDKK